MKDEPKVLIWDIESGSLNADFGVILCIGWKWLGQKKTHLIKITDNPGYDKDRTDDSQVCKDFVKILEQADLQVTWYGKRFDEPFLRSRLIYHGIQGNLPPIPHWDGWETARKELKLSYNRLVKLEDFLDLGEKKSPVSGRIWLKAVGGDRKSLKYIFDHCVADVLVLEEAYLKLRPYTRLNRPNLSAIKGRPACPACGEEGRLQSRGYQKNLLTRWRRYQCQACGAWCKAPEKHPERVR
jgi:uncharacterized protein YprB with RNaseH-like and TPR domain